jgi:peptidoglycan/xylan/chitin deacetylase (PgdA/CDA1 family)
MDPHRLAASTLRCAGAALVLMALACGRPPVLAKAYLGGGNEVVYFQHASERVIALTFDDGPDRVSTPALLSALARHGARATFFLIGSRVPGNEDIVAAIVSAGHEIGNHMMYDEPSDRLTPELFRAQLSQTDATLRPFVPAIRWFRPGSGRFESWMFDAICERGYRGVLGDVYPFDAQLPWNGLSDRLVRASVRPGSIVVLHEGPRIGERTASLLEELLPALMASGYRFVPLSELVEGSGDDRCAALPLVDLPGPVR